MKIKTITLFAIILSFSCKSQTPVVGLEAPPETPSGAYYKDLNNEFNKFVGTWKYSTANEEFIIVFKKLTMIKIGDDFTDYLIREYSYKKNGEVIVNTLPIVNNVKANIGGSYIIKPNQKPVCEDCEEDERRLEMFFNDPEREYLNIYLTLRYLIGSFPQKITIKIYQSYATYLPTDDAPIEPRIPYGEYELVKQ